MIVLFKKIYKTIFKSAAVRVSATIIFLFLFIFFFLFTLFFFAAGHALAQNANALGQLMFSNKIDERLCTEPPSKVDDFKLGPKTQLIEPIVLNTKFKYREVQMLIRLFIGAVAEAIGYQIKAADEPYIYDVGKKIIAKEIDEAQAMKYTWEGENQIFEAIDSFFAARSDKFSKKSQVDRRKLFNLVCEGPIYRTGTPVSITPAAAAKGYTVTPLAASPFPPGHPYAGYNIYMCGTRGVWYFRNAVRRNIDAIKTDLLKEDAQLNAATGIGKVAADKVVEKAADIKTLSEMFKLLRYNGLAEAKFADEKHYEASDIALDPGFNSLMRNTGDMINALKMSGFSVPGDKIDTYKKLWQVYSTPEAE
jgi:hypothetical protein